MKKMLCMLLMLLLSMLVCFPSYANEPETLNLTQVHAYDMYPEFWTHEKLN